MRTIDPAAGSRPSAEAPPHAGNDPWRRIMGLNLRSESAKFILGAFSLDAFSGQGLGSLPAAAAELRFAEHFCRFLSSEPDAHFAIEHRRFISLREPKSVTDVSLCEYGPDGELLRILLVFDPRQPASPDAPEVAEAICTVIAAFNQTRTMSEVARPRVLAQRVSRAGSAAGRLIASRILASTAVSFEHGPVLPGGRFTPPDFRLHRGFGVGYMAARCRLSPDGQGVDLWLQCHHAGGDAGPLQELLGRLEASWGVTAPVVLPADVGNTSVTPAIRSYPGERHVGLLTDFVDFTPLVDLKRRLAPQGSPVSMAGLLLWCLSHQPELAGVGINTAVDVPARGDQPRAVDLVSVWPHRYHGRPDGFVAFQSDLQRLFADARVRATPTWNSIARLTSAPTIVGWAVMRFMPRVTRTKFGTLTVSLIRGVRAIAAPMPDAAWDHGFITIGQLGMASESGPPVTPVSVAGDPGRIRSYPALIRRAIAESRRFVT